MRKAACGCGLLRLALAAVVAKEIVGCPSFADVLVSPDMVHVVSAATGTAGSDLAKPGTEPSAVTEAVGDPDPRVKRSVGGVGVQYVAAVAGLRCCAGVHVFVNSPPLPVPFPRPHVCLLQASCE